MAARVLARTVADPQDLHHIKSNHVSTTAVETTVSTQAGGEEGGRAGGGEVERHGAERGQNKNERGARRGMGENNIPRPELACTNAPVKFHSNL